MSTNIQPPGARQSNGYSKQARNCSCKQPHEHSPHWGISHVRHSRENCAQSRVRDASPGLRAESRAQAFSPSSSQSSAGAVGAQSPGWGSMSEHVQPSCQGHAKHPRPGAIPKVPCWPQQLYFCYVSAWLPSLFPGNPIVSYPRIRQTTLELGKTLQIILSTSIQKSSFS